MKRNTRVTVLAIAASILALSTMSPAAVAASNWGGTYTMFTSQEKNTQVEIVTDTGKEVGFTEALNTYVRAKVTGADVSRAGVIVDPPKGQDGKCVLRQSMGVYLKFGIKNCKHPEDVKIQLCYIPERQTKTYLREVSLKDLKFENGNYLLPSVSILNSEFELTRIAVFVTAPRKDAGDSPQCDIGKIELVLDDGKRGTIFCVPQTCSLTPTDGSKCDCH